MPFRIPIETFESKKLHPIMYFFDSIPDSSFVKTIDSLTRGSGKGFEGATACLFPSELDEFMIASGEGFENGVQFIFFEDEVVIDIDTFWKYMRIACEVYIQEHPEDKDILQEYLARPKPSLNPPPDVAEWMAKWKRGEYQQAEKVS